MWKEILTNVNAAILRNWSSLVWFVLGALLGVFFLGGLISCSVVGPAWDGVKDGTNTVVTTGEDVVTSVYQGGKGLIGDGVGAVEGVVEGGYNLVTDPFVGEDE